MSAGHLWDLPKGNGMATRYQGNQVAESPAVKVNEKQNVKERERKWLRNNQNKITNNGMYNQLRISKEKNVVTERNNEQEKTK